jgi:hypothetical protein
MASCVWITATQIAFSVLVISYNAICRELELEICSIQ